MLVNLLAFLNGTVVPLLLAVAFLYFLWNVARYFIAGGAESDKQESARRLAMWGIMAFVVIVSLWGIVNMFFYGFGLTQTTSITPDYMQGKNNFFDNSGNYDDWQPGANLSGENVSDCTIFAADGSCAGAQNIER